MYTATATDTKKSKRKKRSRDGDDDTDDSHTSVGLFGRRVWNKELFEKRAQQRLEQEKMGIDTDAKRKAQLIRAVPPSERKALTARSSDEVNLHSIVGTRTRITADADDGVVASAQGGYFCNVCQVAIKDSNTYLDHINSQRHLAASGIASRAVKATVSDIRRRLRQPPALSGRARDNMRSTTTAAVTRRAVVGRGKVEEEEIAVSTTTTTTTTATTLETKREQKAAAVGGSDGQDDEMMRILGFSGFTTSKK